MDVALTLTRVGVDGGTGITCVIPDPGATEQQIRAVCAVPSEAWARIHETLTR